jgi:hypothetical protein
VFDGGTPFRHTPKLLLAIALALSPLLNGCGRDQAAAGSEVECNDARVPASLFDEASRELDTSEPDSLIPDAPAFTGRTDLPTKWRVFVEGDKRYYLGGEPPLLAAASVREHGGNWEHQTSGSCTTYLHPSEGRTAIWGVPGGAVAVDATEFTATVIDHDCASGVSAEERVGEPRVTETASSIVVTFTARQPRGGGTCPGHRPATRTVPLKAAVGNRTLLDGAVFPAQPPCDIDSAPVGDGPRTYCNVLAKIR